MLVNEVLEKPPLNGITCIAWILTANFDLVGQQAWKNFFAGKGGVRDAFLALWDILAGARAAPCHSAPAKLQSEPSARSLPSELTPVHQGPELKRGHAGTAQAQVARKGYCPLLFNKITCHAHRAEAQPVCPCAPRAETFAGSPAVLGYDLLNEPYGDEVAEIAPLYEDIAARIRQHDPSAILFVQPQARRTHAHCLASLHACMHAVQHSRAKAATGLNALHVLQNGCWITLPMPLYLVRR